MGHYLTSDEIRTRFVVPLAELSGDFAALCKQWEKAYAAGQIARPDLLLNDVLPEAAIARLANFSAKLPENWKMPWPASIATATLRPSGLAGASRRRRSRAREPVICESASQTFPG